MHAWLQNKLMHHCKCSTTTCLRRSPDLLPNTSPQQTQLHRRQLLSGNCKRSQQVSRTPVDTLLKLSSLPHHNQQLSRAHVGTSATGYSPSAAHSAFAYSNRAKHKWHTTVSKAQKEQPSQSSRSGLMSVRLGCRIICMSCYMASSMKSPAGYPHLSYAQNVCPSQHVFRPCMQ